MKTLQKKKAAEMFARVDEWKVSGMTKREFGVVHGIAKSTFDYWIQKKRKQDKKTPRFVELVAESNSEQNIHQSTLSDSKSTNKRIPQSNKHVELSFPNGLCIKVFM